MPIFEFVCKKCNNEFEDILKYNEIKDEVCPKCGSEVEKKLSTYSFKFAIGSSKISTKHTESCIRIPEFKDKNSDAVGFGNPEIANL